MKKLTENKVIIEVILLYSTFYNTLEEDRNNWRKDETVVEVFLFFIRIILWYKQGVQSIPAVINRKF